MEQSKIKSRSRLLSASAPRALLGALILAGCAGQDPIATGDESDLTGTVFGIKEGSPEAIGVLKVVNTVDYATLHDASGVGLTSNASKNIIKHRNGADGVLGTSDDDLFDKLKELDAVPYVGATTFAKLLAYAQAHGYVQGGKCALPTGSFQLDSPPSAGTQMYVPVERKFAVLSVPTDGPVSIYTRESWQNGSFNGAGIERLSRGASWSKDGFAGLSILDHTSFAATSDADPCVAYVQKGVLRLRCASLSDRAIAGSAFEGVAIAAHGAAKHVIFIEGGNLQYVTTDGSPPQTIDKSWGIESTSLVVDAAGTPHVAYITVLEKDFQSPTRAIKYATKTAMGWQAETIEQEVGNFGTGEGETVSLALDPSGAPVVAYLHRTSRSLRLAVKQAGTFEVATLDAPRPDGGSKDISGDAVVLQIDCAGTRHVVFHRDNLFDPTPNVGLWYARVEDGKLKAVEPLPKTSARFYPGYPHTLSFIIAPDGHQHVAAQLLSIGSARIYYIHR